MDEQGDDVEKKQELLQKEIIEKNLSSQDFVAFCQKKKENGDDLLQWTYEELVQLVEEFKNAGRRGSSQPELVVSQEPQEEVKAENIAKTVEQMQASDAPKENKPDKEKDYKCKVLEKSVLCDNMVEIEVLNPRQENAGLLKNTYTLYEIVTQPFGWRVLRRYSDFDWLRQTLIKIFPGHYVPPIPSKKIGNRRLEEDFIIKRMKFLTSFINSVCKNENFKASEPLICFLSYQERHRFEAKMREYVSIQPIGFIDDIRNIEGKVTLTSDEANKKYFSNIEKYFTFQTQILKKVNSTVKDFCNNLRDASANLSVLSKSFELLFFLNNRVMMKEKITRTYEELQNFCENWSVIFSKQLNAVQTHFKDFFKQLKIEGEAFQELVEARSNMENKYTSEFIRISLKKDKLFNSKDISKFEISPSAPVYDNNRILVDKTYAFSIMCSKENAMLDQIEKFMQYYNKMALSQLKVLVKEHCDRFYMNFRQFDERFKPTMDDVRK